MKIVQAKSYEGSNLSWNLNILSGPKFTIQCGECNCHFQKRIPVVNYPTVVCPYCCTGNKLNLVVE